MRPVPWKSLCAAYIVNLEYVPQKCALNKNAPCIPLYDHFQFKRMIKFETNILCRKSKTDE